MFALVFLLVFYQINCVNCYSKWTVEGGIQGETCSDSETASRSGNSQTLETGEKGNLWCENVIIPDCEDRTVNCTAPPMPPSCTEVC